MQRVSWLVAVGVVWAACGTTSPAVDSGSGLDAGADAGRDAGTDGGRDAGLDAGRPDAGLDAGPPFNIYDILPADGGLSACRTCLDTGSCGATINACVNDTACVNGVVCTISRCIAPQDGGVGLSPDASVAELLPCAIVCFNNDVLATLSAAGALACGAGCAPTCAFDVTTTFFPDAGRPSPDGG